MSSSLIKAKYNSLLLLTANLSDLKLKRTLEESLRHTSEALYVYFNPQPSEPSVDPTSLKQTLTDNPITNKYELRNTINRFYRHFLRHNHTNINVSCLLHNPSLKVIRPDLNYDLVMTDSSRHTNTDLYQFCAANLPSSKLSATSPIILIDIDSSKENEDLPPTHEGDLLARDHSASYRNSIVAGTFDRLHIGHKIMLTESALLTTHRLLVGITHESMLNGKVLHELIEDWHVRADNVRRFINTIAPWLQVETVSISDPFGPSIVEADYQCLIVSQETIRGGNAVNERRVANSLSPMDVHVVTLVNTDHEDVKDEDKVSSSNQRRHLLGELLKPPRHEFDPTKPYIVGITGGLASGKSSIRRDLEELGAASVDCDELGHQSYTRGTPAFSQICATFGDDIVDAATGEINRRKLGAKVFNAPGDLKKLTDIVWPEIYRLLQERIANLFAKGFKIIVVEAAVMLDAKWYENFNEIWVAYVPNDEAIRRSVERDKIDTQKAQNILNAQMSNVERLRYANVVFCSLWERQYTKSQVKKAYTKLLQRTIHHTSPSAKI